MPIQAYFESGFPYGVNQWISAAATGWATTALALASQTAPAFRGRRRRPGPPKPEDGSAAPDGYAPIPQWLGQTRAPHPAKTRGVRRRDRRRRVVGRVLLRLPPRRPDDRRRASRPHPDRRRRTARCRSRSTGCRPISGRRGQGLFEVRPDRAFASNRRIFLTYTVLPEGANQAALPRSPGVLMVASATLSPTSEAREPEGAAERGRHRRRSSSSRRCAGSARMTCCCTASRSPGRGGTGSSSRDPSVRDGPVQRPWRRSTPTTNISRPRRGRSRRVPARTTSTPPRRSRSATAASPSATSPATRSG